MLAAIRRSKREQEKPAFRNEPGHLLPYLLAGPVLGVACILIYASAVGGADALAIGLAAALAALLGGALLGFLFAIPRNPALPTGTGPDRYYRSNSNLEEISDWLTKILVGLGLVQFGKLLDAGRTLVDALASALGNESSSASYAVTVLVIFGVSGFLGVYVLTRVYLGPIFAESEEAMKAFMEEKIEQRVGERVDEKVDARVVDAKVDAKIDASVGQKLDASVDQKLDAKVDEKIDQKLDESVDQKLDAKVDEKIEKLDARVEDLAKKVSE